MDKLALLESPDQLDDLDKVVDPVHPDLKALPDLEARKDLPAALDEASRRTSTTARMCESSELLS